jgi:uncharacterized membrane protein HdeD (DUF308 family)
MLTVLIITIFFGAYAIVDGVYYIISGLNHMRKAQNWHGLIFSGIFSTAACLMVLIKIKKFTD